MKQFSISILILISLNSSGQLPAYEATINSGAPGGYYFTSALRFDKTGSTQMVLDSAGGVVYYKHFNLFTHDLQLQSNGLVSYFNADLNKFYLMDSTFTIVDSVYAKNGYTTDTHEMQILPNGHYLFLATEIVPMDLSNYQYFENSTAYGSANAKVTCAIIQEQDQNKNVVFEWHSKNYFPFNSTDPFFLLDTINVDWIHSNALEVDSDGNILMSSRHFDEITKINRQDSSIIWRFGGKYNQFTFIGDTTPFYGQHDIRRLSNGHVSLFDDANHFTPHGARACEFQLDEINKTAQLVWSDTHDTAMFSIAMGSVRRTVQGATVMDYGDINKKDNICFNVVDSSGDQLFNITFQDTLYSYRTYNYPKLPWNLQRPQIACSVSGDTLYLTASSGYSGYTWSNGAHTQTIAVTSPDSFYVFVPYGQGGFISSEKTIVSNVQNYCGTAGIAEAHLNGSVRTYPNPVQNELTINTDYGLKNITIYDVFGQPISSQQETGNGKQQTTLDVSALASGIYFIRVTGDKEGWSGKFVKE